jgi:glycyl-tRNA synthetase
MLPNKLNINRKEFEDTCKRKFIFDAAFDIYGGTSGLYDYGPILCTMKNNFLQNWRRHFVVEDNLCEIECTCVTPEEIFINSGHVAKFNDIMCKDVCTGECIRLDKHIEQFLEQSIYRMEHANDPDKFINPNDARWESNYVDYDLLRTMKQLLIDVGSMNIEQLSGLIKRFNIKSPNGNDLSEPFPFNLMFKNNIGPDSNKTGYLRPELAQGIFMNFKRILDTYNAKQIPFGIASIGQAFRNEIAPRNSLLRVREFTLAEIEYFVDPNNKNHPKFNDIMNVKIYAWNRNSQTSGNKPEQKTIGELVNAGIINNQTLGFYIAKTQQFLENIGMKYIRFRQHRSDEMAHYACDCWDAECLSSYGWIECVGIADRSAYDLTCHSNGSKKDLSVREELKEPIFITKRKAIINDKLIKEKYGKEAGKIINYLKKKSVN